MLVTSSRFNVREPPPVSSSPLDEVFLNALRRIFGKRAILFGEDPALYDQLLELVAADVKPQTMREWLLVKDIVDSQWEFWRVRGLKAGVLHASLPQLIASQIAANNGGLVVLGGNQDNAFQLR